MRRIVSPCLTILLAASPVLAATQDPALVLTLPLRESPETTLGRGVRPASEVGGLPLARPSDEVFLTLGGPGTPHASSIAVPDKLFLPAAGIAVALDTPLSTRITKKGMEVVFLTTEAIHLGGGISLPPDTRILALVVEAKKPGMFGRAGGMKIRIEKIEVDSQAVPVVARLEGVDANAGKIKSDSSRAANLYGVVSYSVMGTLMGATLAGGKGALMGAGAGAAAALIMAMSKRGPDLYLEPGTPFAVMLDEPVELPGKAVYAAQLNYERLNGPLPGREPREQDYLNSASDPGRPQLARRPKPPQP